MLKTTPLIDKSIMLGGQLVPYSLKISSRSRRYLRLAIGRSGNLIVTVPRRVSLRFVEQCISQKAEWILDKLAHIAKISHTAPVSTQNMVKCREEARRLVISRIEHFNSHYNFTFGKITIRNQQTRWGSCSKRGNLNFNYRLALISPELADYVIVHELCHLGEFNHSRKFWALVAQTIPDYLSRRRQLRQEGLRLL